MKTNRRGFFKVLGAGAVGSAIVKPAKAEKKSEWVPVVEEPKEYTFVTVCTVASTPTRWKVVPFADDGA